MSIQEKVMAPGTFTVSLSATLTPNSIINGLYSYDGQYNLAPYYTKTITGNAICQVVGDYYSYYQTLINGQWIISING